MSTSPQRPPTAKAPQARLSPPSPKTLTTTQPFPQSPARSQASPLHGPVHARTPLPPQSHFSTFQFFFSPAPIPPRSILEHSHALTSPFFQSGHRAAPPVVRCLFTSPAPLPPRADSAMVVPGGCPEFRWGGWGCPRRAVAHDPKPPGWRWVGNLSAFQHRAQSRAEQHGGCFGNIVSFLHNILRRNV